MQPFQYRSQPVDIVFGAETRQQLGEWVGHLGCRRALVLSTPGRTEAAQELGVLLGNAYAGHFNGATMHTPVDVTMRALEAAKQCQADCLVAMGGGSTTGLSKAIALRSGLPQIILPTSYAGSEVTDILGQTEDGAKTTIRDPRVLPEIVIYDPALTLGLPLSFSVVSGLNAMAHAAEALYAVDRNPLTTMIALEALRLFREALPALVASPSSLKARSKALYGAWLAGISLGSVSMALHHKLCHTLGGSFDLPHGEVHAIMLPHTLAYNQKAVPEMLAPAAALFDGDLAQGIWGFAKSLGAPTALHQLGLEEASLDLAAERAIRNPYATPRAVEFSSLRRMLQRAWEGLPPKG